MAKDRYKYFRIEARELLDGLSRGVLDLERAPADRELVARLLRLAHTLKGAARVVQLAAIAEHAHRAEDALGPHRDASAPPVPRDTVDLLLQILDDIARELARVEEPRPGGEAAAPEAPGSTVSPGAGVARGSSETRGSPEARAAAGATPTASPAGLGAPGQRAAASAASSSGVTGVTGAGTGGGATGAGAAAGMAMAPGGAAGAAVGGPAGAPGSADEPGVTPASAGSVAQPSAAPPSQPAARAPLEDFRSVRVDLAELDGVVDSVLQASVKTTTLRRDVGRLEHSLELARALQDHLARGSGEDPLVVRARALASELQRSVAAARDALGSGADQAEREIAQVRGSADRLRLLPARAIFASLERAARDAARATGRGVEFEASGGELRVDAHVLSLVRDALMHVVRNAVAHGIESAAERTRRGKRADGVVRVSVERRGSRLAFRCRDDGRGVDTDAVRQAAVRSGLLDAAAAAALDTQALTQLLLRGGFTTRTTVTDLAGRGVGLDVVRETAARLEGQVTIRSAPGEGTTVEMVVPMSLAAMTVLHAEAAGVVVAVPLDGVRSTAFLEPSRVTRGAGSAGVTWSGEHVPFVPLATVLGRPLPEERRLFWSAVLVEAGGRVAAIGADRLHGTSDVVVRPLPAFVDAHGAVAGASLDAEGHPQIVLDPAGLVAAASSREHAAEEPAPRVRPPVLVIDDSLTTRMLEQSILESAGYEVELAVSAEEGLAKARARRFGVFVVDVEMPGMDGFEFVRVTRADARLSSTPAILVTSRAAPEDRRQGSEAGASAYIVKGEFDQGRLLATIRELMG